MSSGASRLAPVLHALCRTATSSPVRLAGSKPIIAAFVTVAVVNFIVFPSGQFPFRFCGLFSFSPESERAIIKIMLLGIVLIAFFRSGMGMACPVQEKVLCSGVGYNKSAG